MAYSKLAPYGEFFLKQGRPDFTLKGCVILCFATYEEKSLGTALRTAIVEKSFSLFSHAEKSILREIDKIEKDSDT
jgi:hypothetical protein